MSSLQSQISVEEVESLETSSEYEDTSRRMLLMKLAGRSKQDIAARFGVVPDMVDDMVNDSIMRMLETKQHYLVQQALLNRLLEADVALRELYDETPTLGERWYEALNNDTGKRETLREQTLNHTTKIKILAERRQNALATKVMLALDPGDTTDMERAREKSDIFSAIRAATEEFSKTFTTKLVEEAEKVGRLEKDNSKTIEISPEPGDEKNE